MYLHPLLFIIFREQVFLKSPHHDLLRPDPVHYMVMKRSPYGTPLKGKFYSPYFALFCYQAENQELFSGGGHQTPFSLSTASGGGETGPDSGLFWPGSMHRETFMKILRYYGCPGVNLPAVPRNVSHVTGTMNETLIPHHRIPL